MFDNEYIASQTVNVTDIRTLKMYAYVRICEDNPRYAGKPLLVEAIKE